MKFTCGNGQLLAILILLVSLHSGHCFGNRIIKRQFQTATSQQFYVNEEPSPTPSVCGESNLVLTQKNKMFALPPVAAEYLLQSECQWVIKSALAEKDSIITLELLDSSNRDKYFLSISLSGTQNISTPSNPLIEATELQIPDKDLHSTTSWIELKGGFSQITITFSMLPDLKTLDALSLFKFKIYYKEEAQAPAVTVASVDYYFLLVKFVVIFVIAVAVMSLGIFACVIKNHVVEQGRVRRRGALNRRWSDTVVVIDHGSAPLVELEEDESEGSVSPFARSDSTRSTGSNYSVGSDICILCSKDLLAFGESADVQTLDCGHVFHQECSENWMRLLRERHMPERCAQCSRAQA